MLPPAGRTLWRPSARGRPHLRLSLHVPFQVAKGFTLRMAEQGLSGRIDIVITTVERHVRLV